MFRKPALLQSSGLGTSIEVGALKTSYSVTGPVAENNLFYGVFHFRSFNAPEDRSIHRFRNVVLINQQLIKSKK
jgi:hypothetical protein